MLPRFSHLLSLLLLFISTLTLHSLTAKASPEFLYNDCQNTNTTTFSNSTYKTNLNTLLATLASNATAINGFYNYTVGSQASNTVYGLFLCEGDINPDVCQSCVALARNDLKQNCSTAKVGITYYDQCLLRYSNVSIFSTLALSPALVLYNVFDINIERDKFIELVGETMNDIKGEAARGTDKKFATKEAKFTDSDTLYTLAQCTPDLSTTDCNTCLTMCINYLDTGRQGARTLLPSCNVRFEIYPFYNFTATTAPAPAPVALSPPTRRTNTTAPPPTLETEANEKGISTTILVAIIIPVAASAAFLTILCYCLLRKKKEQKAVVQDKSAVDEITNVQSLQYDLRTIETATNNFSIENKIGEGGFGDVYKGTLSNGQEVAVKRLSEGSRQGAEQFKNEVVLVAKLQHRNLVRLLGFCLEGKEKILIYEYVPNKSLDHHLFDPETRGQLDWSRRYKIIEGITRGILYLHEDSRLRIIHRDLKPSNVLLDADMNPKVSDFGMARIFGVDQSWGNTNRIVGTFGYMPPEYAMHGYFSVKSDVYSFGVLILEIISGQKNSHFYQPGCTEDLLSYAWKLWKEDVPLELVDETIRDSYSRNEVLRCIQIGLLCVQEDPDMRPTMASVMLMLNSFSITLSLPQKPAFCVWTRTRSELTFPIKGLESDQSTSKSVPFSVNDTNKSENGAYSGIKTATLTELLKIFSRHTTSSAMETDMQMPCLVN
ncbi:Gnk2-homologous domain [Dillenia turbinata]|uniref:Gnk2-homologous domain n=1 Tax=Dillenia turbinata TaxID=194707 RepID=A0AAN8UTM2_9MAGN